MSVGMCDFLGFHWQLVLRNATTIEDFDLSGAPGEGSKFDVGMWSNLEQVFGPLPLLWWLPLPLSALGPLGDGLVYATRSKVDASLPDLTKQVPQSAAPLSWKVYEDMRGSLLAELFDLHDRDHMGWIENSVLSNVNSHIQYLLHERKVPAPKAAGATEDLVSASSKTLGLGSGSTLASLGHGTWRQKSCIVSAGIDADNCEYIDRLRFVRYYKEYLGHTDNSRWVQLWILKELIEEIQRSHLIKDRKA